MKLTLLPLRDDNLIRLRCEGEPQVPAAGSDPLEALLGPQCYSHKVLLDMERLPLIDTSGVCWLLAKNKKFQQANGKLILYHMPPVVRDVLAILRLDGMLHIAPDEAGACALAAADEETPPLTFHVSGKVSSADRGMPCLPNRHAERRSTY
jgi:anti-anti-sigma factor